MWTGFIQVELNDPYRFSVEGNGESTLTVNGIPALDGNEVELRQGLNRFELVYDSPARGASEFRLYWESQVLSREPVPSTVFARPQSIPELDEGARNRSARALVAQYRCLQCHAPGRDTLQNAMPELRADAPALDRVGEKYKESWLVQRILEPATERPNSAMPRVIHGPDAQKNLEEAAGIARYLMTLSRPAQDVSLSLELRDTGEAVYNDLGCFTCHRFSQEDSLDENQTRISLQQIQDKWRTGALIEYLLNPQRDYAHNPMPNFALSNDEAQALAQYVFSAGNIGANAQEAVSGNANAGRELIETRGCLNCHTISGHGTSLAAASLAKLRDSDMNAGCLSDTAAGRSGAPDFNLSEQDRSALRSFIAKKSDALFRFDPSEYAERQVQALDCLACHGRDGVGDRWSLLAPEDPATTEGNVFADDFWDGESTVTIHLQRPKLDFAGEKLRTGWMTDFLAGKLEYKPRPGLIARMPGFPAHAKDLAQGLAAQHGFAPLNADRSTVDTALAAAGRELALSEDLFRCNMCHGVGADSALAGADTETINFAHIPQRLRRGYFDRFTMTPQRILPGTQMPQFAGDDGRSAVPHILDGDMSRQFDALWHFMRSLASQNDTP